MKNFLVISGCVLAGLAIISCNDTRRSPGRSYMPDMTYSVAYETYAPTNRLDSTGAHYNGRPVEGTIARGDMFPYMVKNDTAGYKQSAAIRNPLDSGAIEMKEAARLYLVNCGICHGSKLDGNGPLYKGGDGPYVAKPAVLVGDATIEALSEGTMFHVVTYGKGQMGSYASQLSAEQRWMVVAYVKSKQAGGKGATSAKADSTAAKPATDSMSTAIK